PRVDSRDHLPRRRRKHRSNAAATADQGPGSPALARPRTDRHRGVSGWLAQFAAEMKRRRLEIPFECITRADRLNPAVAATLAELGCFRVWIGSESGSQRILDSMQRGVKVEQVR